MSPLQHFLCDFLRDTTRAVVRVSGTVLCERWPHHCWSCRFFEESRGTRVTQEMFFRLLPSPSTLSRVTIRFSPLETPFRCLIAIYPLCSVRFRRCSRCISWINPQRRSRNPNDFVYVVHPRGYPPGFISISFFLPEPRSTLVRRQRRSIHNWTSNIAEIRNFIINFSIRRDQSRVSRFTQQRRYTVGFQTSTAIPADSVLSSNPMVVTSHRA